MLLKPALNQFQTQTKAYNRPGQNIAKMETHTIKNCPTIALKDSPIG
jgi:hypothetical protein